MFFSTSLCAIEQSGQISLVLKAGYCIYDVTKLADMGAKIYANNYPDDEKQAAVNKAGEVNEYFKAKKEFRSCLLRHYAAQRNTAERPTVCEDLAAIFALIAGNSGLDEITENFKIAYEE